MASDFQRPRSWMASLSTPAQSRAVAPPGRRDLAESSLASMPVMECKALAEWRRALVTCLLVTEYQRR